MISGMTGFAERTFSSGSVRLRITIKTLNHRFFDWSFRGMTVGGAESRLRSACQARISRGRVEAGLEVALLGRESWEFEFNSGLLEKIFSAVDLISQKTGRSLPVSLDGLLCLPQIYEARRRNLTQAELDFLEKSFRRTLDDVLKMRRKEGQETARQISLHLIKVKNSVGRIERLFRKQPAMLKRKFEKRIRDFNGGGSALPENRLAEEVNLLIQRHDLAEEISRLKMHVADCGKLLSGRSGGPIGKQIDFLAQEMHREANTINSKSQDISITRECLAIKSGIESIREQAQNLE